MAKVRMIIGSTYCGCSSEEIEFEYYGIEEELTEILNMIFNGDFPHYFVDIDFEENEEECEDD